ncbi:MULTISPECIES: YIP1 family protein [unclassified Staphylococcus]|uniref:YIP1 family protein n=1 Tax=unclassified Staphylococcus TaxID=91994 RepID=UPI0021D22CF6|nr:MULTISPECIES: YIP1 family protein [unclassified Staphylococcus]UXR78195.1 YIP1 family protein [Staphylococcus sp. IVB6227]UXR82358.1 YIP1 family protein [Staphylococcus sp. IVB6214]
MDFFKPLHIESFEKQRSEPKVGIKFLILLIILAASTVVSGFALDFNALTAEQSNIQGVDSEQLATYTKYFSLIGIVIGALFALGFMFLVLFIIDKISKSETRPKSIFASLLLRVIIIQLIQLVAITIQWIVGIDATQYSITSLNVFDPDNDALRAISLTTLVSAWLFGVTLHSTMHINKRWSLILTFIYLLLFMGLPLIFALI